MDATLAVLSGERLLDACMATNTIFYYCLFSSFSFSSSDSVNDENVGRLDHSFKKLACASKSCVRESLGLLFLKAKQRGPLYVPNLPTLLLKTKACPSKQTSKVLIFYSFFSLRYFTIPRRHNYFSVRSLKPSPACPSCYSSSTIRINIQIFYWAIK